jgi:hypothetical protein
MLDAAARDGIDRKFALEQWCHDGYGNLFNVDFKTNLVARGAPPPLTNISLDVLVWSSGANGTNELGNGDDIAPP